MKKRDLNTIILGGLGLAVMLISNIIEDKKTEKMMRDISKEVYYEEESKKQ